MRVPLFTLAVFLATLALYIRTLALASLGKPRCGQRRAHCRCVLWAVFRIPYPFYMILARLFIALPIHTVAFRVNHALGLWRAATVAILFVIIRSH